MIIEFEDLADRQEKVLEALSGFLGINAGKFRFSGPLHANVSLKGEKLPAKYDGVLKLGAPVLRLLPESWKARLRNYLTPRHRTFDKKPELTTAEKEAIINFTRLDILALSELTGKDLSKWLEIK
ncbi:MAG: hypothetical protein U5N26_06340 [Candidatus Marinimicrobia bacterium]|nr:hypothetical protein [Candidatus Neomarinimicrobiota bacterium]